MHAVDRASTRLWHLYQAACDDRPDDAEPLGIVTWLRSYAIEAVANGQHLPRSVSVPGLCGDLRQRGISHNVLDGSVLLLFRREGRKLVLITIITLSSDQARSLRIAAAAFQSKGAAA